MTPERAVEELRKRREREGLTMERQAELLGVYVRTLYFWDSRDTNPSPSRMRRIERYLNHIPVDLPDRVVDFLKEVRHHCKDTFPFLSREADRILQDKYPES